MLMSLYTHWRSSYMGIPRNIWFLALVNLVNRCGSMVIAFITLYLTQRLQFDIREAGYVMGFFGAGALAGTFIGGRLTDRLGYRSVQFWSLVLNGLMLILLMFIRDFWTMCGAVFILSTVSESFRPANAVAIMQNSGPETRTRSISLMRMAFNIGWTIAPVFGGLLVALGWDWLFWVDGITCILAAVALLGLLGEAKPAVKDAKSPETTPSTVVRSPYKDTQFLLFLALTFVGAVVFMQIMWTVPVFFKETYHWSEAQIGMMVAVNGALVFLVEMPLIFRLEGTRSQFYFIRVGLLLYAFSYLMFNCPLPAVGAALLYMLLISFGEIFVMPFSSNYTYGRATHGNQGSYSALYGMSYSLANIFAPLFGTQIIGHLGYHTLWYVVAILACLTLVGFWVMEKKTVDG